MIDDIKWYIYNTERCIYNDIDDEIYDLKTQIAERELLKAPKVGSWQSVGITNEYLDQIRAAAKEVQAFEDDYLEEEWSYSKTLKLIQMTYSM